MADCTEVITKALKKARILGEMHEPTAYDLTNGLDALEQLYQGWIASGLFGRLTDVTGTGDVTAESGQRIRRSTADAWSVTIPDFFDEELPRNRTVVRVADPFTGGHVIAQYDANTGSWWALNSLTLESFAPLSNLGEGLACCLAEVIADERGGGVGPITQRAAARFKSSLALGFDNERQAVPTEFF